MIESIKKGFIKRAQEYGVPNYKAENLLKKAGPVFDDPYGYMDSTTKDLPLASSILLGGIGALGGGAAGYYLKDKDKRTWKDALTGAGVGGLGGAALGYATGSANRNGMLEGVTASETLENKFKSLTDPTYNPFSKADPSETTNTAIGALAGAGIGGLANYQGNSQSALKGALVGGLAGGLGTHIYRDADRAGKQLGFAVGNVPEHLSYLLRNQ